MTTPKKAPFKGVTPGSMVMTRIGPYDVPMVSKPRCRVCQSPHRIYIENQLLQGLKWAVVAEMVAGLDVGPMPHPNASQLKRHWEEGHMPVNQAVQRRLLERRQEEIGESMTHAFDTGVDEVVVSQMIMTRAFQRMQAGEIDPTVAEGLAAAKQLSELKKAGEQTLDQQAWINAMSRFFEVVKEMLTDDQWLAFGNRLLNDPILSAMMHELQRTVDGEVKELT